MCEKTEDRLTQSWQVEPKGLRDRCFKCSYWLKGRIHPSVLSITWEWQNCPVHGSKTCSLRSHTECATSRKSDSSCRSASTAEKKRSGFTETIKIATWRITEAEHHAYSAFTSQASQSSEFSHYLKYSTMNRTGTVTNSLPTHLQCSCCY